MKAAIAAISALVAIGIAAGFVFPPDRSEARATVASDLELETADHVFVSQDRPSRPALAAWTSTAQTQAAGTHIEVSLADIVGAAGVFGGGFVGLAVWFRSRHPVTRFSHPLDERGRDRAPRP